MVPTGSPICESGWMRKGIEVRLGPGDRERLEAVIGSGNSPQKHVWGGRIFVLGAAPPGKAAVDAGAHRAGGQHDTGRAARRGDTLDLSGDGQGRRGQPSQRAADLGGARPQTAPGANLQTVE